MASAIKNDTKIAVGWIGDGSTAESGLPRRAGLRLDLQGAGRPQHRQQSVGDLDLPGHRPGRLRHLRGARPRLRHSGAAGRRQRLSRRHAVAKWAVERARRNLGPDADRARDLSGRRAFHLRRPLRLPPQDGIRCLAARRPGHPAEEPPDRARRLVGGAPQAGGSGNRGRGDRRAEGGREARHPAFGRQALGPATCSRASSRTCRRTCAGSGSRRESEPCRARR